MSENNLKESSDSSLSSEEDNAGDDKGDNAETTTSTSGAASNVTSSLPPIDFGEIREALQVLDRVVQRQDFREMVRQGIANIQRDGHRLTYDAIKMLKESAQAYIDQMYRANETEIQMRQGRPVQPVDLLVARLVLSELDRITPLEEQDVHGESSATVRGESSSNTTTQQQDTNPFTNCFLQ